MAPIYGAFPDIRVTILASPGHIALRLSRWIETDAEGAELDTLSSRLKTELGDAVFSSSGQKLEEVIGEMLRDAGLTLGVAESCTAGMIGARITRVAGSSAYFVGGIICYSNALKTGLCRVAAKTLEAHGAVSAETAEALARGVREATGAGIGLAVTGIAGPGGGSAEKPVGLVFVGISSPAATIHHRRVIPGDRESMRERTAYFALSSLRRFLLQRPDADS